jgi:hypothetical protein
MTFLEQVDAFHAADIVVGSSSSALTNGLFCRPDCRILGLIHANLSFNFRGYASFIEAGGAQITFLRGTTTNEEGHAFHANYRVSPEAVTAALANLAPALRTEADAGADAGSSAARASESPPAAVSTDSSLFKRVIRVLPFANRPDS